MKEPKKHPKHDLIAELGRAKKSKAYIKKTCKVAHQAIVDVFALEGIEHNPTGVQAAPLLAPPLPDDTGTASLITKQGRKCWGCDATYVKSDKSWHRIGGIDNLAYAVVCPDCAVLRLLIMPHTSIGLYRMQRVYDDYRNVIIPQLAARKAAEEPVIADADQDDDGRWFTTYSKGGKPCDANGNLLP